MRKRVLAALLLPMLLSSCSSWDWRATGRDLLASACEGARQCRADGGPGYRPPSDRPPAARPPVDWAPPSTVPD